MCLILLAWRCHPQFPLVVAANRDEFFDRPTAAAAVWGDAPHVLAGRDLRAGGTWMGIDRHGRFAALTNFRDPALQRDGMRSRGELVADFLRREQPPEDYLDGVHTAAASYNGFNLLLADRGNLIWYSNVDRKRRRLAPGIYGVSNHLLDTPWPKLVAAKSALTKALGALPDDTALLALLRDDRVYPDHSLPRTGVDIAWERLLSAAFVKSSDYGTVSSSVVLFDNRGTVVFDEQSWLPGAQPGKRTRLRYSSINTSV